MEKFDEFLNRLNIEEIDKYIDNELEKLIEQTNDLGMIEQIKLITSHRSVRMIRYILHEYTRWLEDEGILEQRDKNLN